MPQIEAALAKFQASDAATSLEVHDSNIDQINTANRNNDASNIDADLADIIFQVALNGKVIFG